MARRDARAHVRQVRFRTSINLLDHLGLNMYSSVPKAIGEVVVNGYDADATTVEITSSASAIVIEDDGLGMSADEVAERYMILASGHKRREPRTPLLRRLPIGAKGIGKLAGLGIARRIEVETWRDGTMNSYAIDRDEMEKAERGGAANEAMLDRAHIAVTATPTRREGSGTRVTLRKLRHEARFDAKKVREHLAQELPLGDHFRVRADGEWLSKAEVKGKKVPIRENHPVCGLIQGRLVIASQAQKHPGVITTVRGRAVGGPSFFGMVVSNRRYHSHERITGQVEVGGLDPDDGTPTAIKTDREGFLTSHPRYVAYADFMQNVIEKHAKAIEDDADKRRDDERRAKLNEAVAKAAEVFNAFNEHERRLMQSSIERQTRGRVNEDGTEVVRPVVEINPTGDRPRTDDPRHETARQVEAFPVLYGNGRLRFRGQTFYVQVLPRGEAAPECEIARYESLIIVNEEHPSYAEAERNRWTEGIVFRAVATRFACEESTTAEEAYELLDKMTRFAAQHDIRRRGKGASADDALAPAV
jgi:hypothetical protein